MSVLSPPGDVDANSFPRVTASPGFLSLHLKPMAFLFCHAEVLEGCFQLIWTLHAVHRQFLKWAAHSVKVTKPSRRRHRPLCQFDSCLPVSSGGLRTETEVRRVLLLEHGICSAGLM